MRILEDRGSSSIERILFRRSTMQGSFWNRSLYGTAPSFPKKILHRFRSILKSRTRYVSMAWKRSSSELVKVKHNYAIFLQEYETLGHMRMLSDAGTDLTYSGYYTPHHAVVREGSMTFSIRVVFNASRARLLRLMIIFWLKLHTDGSSFHYFTLASI